MSLIPLAKPSHTYPYCENWQRPLLQRAFFCLCSPLQPMFVLPSLSFVSPLLPPLSPPRATAGFEYRKSLVPNTSKGKTAPSLCRNHHLPSYSCLMAARVHTLQAYDMKDMEHKSAPKKETQEQGIILLSFSKHETCLSPFACCSPLSPSSHPTSASALL